MAERLLSQAEVLCFGPSHSFTPPAACLHPFEVYHSTTTTWIMCQKEAEAEPKQRRTNEATNKEYMNIRFPPEVWEGWKSLNVRQNIKHQATPVGDTCKEAVSGVSSINKRREVLNHRTTSLLEGKMHKNDKRQLSGCLRNRIDKKICSRRIWKLIEEQNSGMETGTSSKKLMDHLTKRKGLRMS